MRSERWAHVSLLAPELPVVVFAFVVAPFAFAVVISFWTSSIFGLTPDFQFGNYIRVFSNPVYRDFDSQDAAGGIRHDLPRAIAVISDGISAFRHVRPRQGHHDAGVVPAVFWISYVVRSFVWLPILGTNGAVNRALLASD